MSNYVDPQAFKVCYAQYQKADNDRDVLFAQLLEGYESLHKENTKVLEQLENEKETRIMWQDNARTYKKELTMTKLTTVSGARPRAIGHTRVTPPTPVSPVTDVQQESHPFVVMIIDGDGAKFRDDFFRNGDNGGGYAAQELKKQIKSHLQAKYPDTSIDNWNIIVHFYANMDGLAKTLASRRILSNWTDLQKFASGFGRANSLFSFVDVGYGKDKADHKCREMLKVMLHVSSCRHVFFGPCRDNGYLTLLEEYKHDPIINEKLTLFTAEPAEPGFLALDFEIVNFPTVFRAEPLDNFRYPQPMGLDIGIQPFPPAHSPLPIVPVSNSLDEFSDCTGSSSFAPTAPSPSSSVDNGSASAPPTWACVSKLSNAPIIDLYSKKTAAPKLKYVLFNASNQRVDERLPSADVSALKSIDTRARAQGRNFCNFYHLTGFCDKGPSCEYMHDCQPRLTPSEKLALRHKSRQIVCNDNRWCESPYCLSGHHCKNIYNGQACSWGPKCFFRETHDAADVVRCSFRSKHLKRAGPKECG